MRHRFLLSGTLAIGALMLSACSSGRSQLEVRAAGQGAAPLQSGAQMVQAARQHLNDGQYGLAIGQFRALLMSDPNSAFAHNGLAVAYDAIGRTDLARRHFERAVLSQPQDPTYARNLARLAARDEQRALAKAQANRHEQARSRAPAPEIYRLRMARLGGASLVATGRAGVALVTRKAPSTTSTDMSASMTLGEDLSSGARLPFTLERVRTGQLLVAGQSPVLKRVSHYEVRVVAKNSAERMAIGQAQSGAAKSGGSPPAGRKTLWQAGVDLQQTMQATVSQIACERSLAPSSTALTGMIWMNQRCAS